ncbi:MAG: hypothetical protein JWQ07_4914 [Ramlibacter sp.]|nr:hypothetical protein [Ramlibacter sp.]
MQRLRNAALLARLVLAWFALSIGVAVASPVIKPQGIELICSGSGAIKLLAQGDDAGKPLAAHTLDCPLCAPFAAPPVANQGLAHSLPLAHAVQAIPAARIAALTAAPPPARGPPTLCFL